MLSAPSANVHHIAALLPQANELLWGFVFSFKVLAVIDAVVFNQPGAFGPEEWSQGLDAARVYAHIVS